MTLSKITTFIAEARKAVAAAASVAAVIVVMDVPEEVKTVGAAILAVAAAFGITYRVSNKPKA